MMTLKDALTVADHAYATDGPVSHAAILLAAEIRRLQSEVTALRLYAPARRAQPTVKTAPIGPTKHRKWGIVGILDETDEEFAERAGRKVAEAAR